jgi:hypothetical protein
MKHIFLTGVLLLAISVTGISQKVKYKDLFVLLKAENYDDAGSYLRSFLGNEPDHPNANYNMGKMLQYYMYEEDILNRSNRIIEIADSAILYFDNALKLNTEKYVESKHDDDYYADFRRRNYRTGKFEVKLSDVQLDMEERKKAITKFKEDVLELKYHFEQSIRYYDSCQHYFKMFAAKAESNNVLYFTATQNDLQNLRRLTTYYDSSIYNFNTYRSIMTGMGKSAIKQNLEEKPVINYPADGLLQVDFYATTVVFVNYKEWAGVINDKILKQILPLKKRMVEFDKELMEIHDKTIKDSLDSRPSIFKLATSNVARDIEIYDSASLPAAIYNYRIAEINYHSAVNYWYKEVVDTIDVGVKIDVLSDFEKQYSGIAELLAAMNKANNEHERKIFREYISERYTDDAGLTEFIKGQEANYHQDGVQLQEWLAIVEEQNKITSWHDDTISLIVGQHYLNEDSVRYSTILVDPLPNRKIGFYAWKEGYEAMWLSFSTSPSSRVLDTLFAVPIDPKLIEQRSLNLKFLSDSINARQRVWVLNATEPDSDAKYTTQIFTTNLDNGPGWNKEFSLNTIPEVLHYDQESKRLVLSNGHNETVMVLDINGNEQVAEGTSDEEKGN